MNKTQLIDALAERFEGNRKAAAAALDAVLDTITREVARGEKVAITGFGSFERKVRDSRWVRNPRTGERIKAQASAIARFKPGAELLGVVSGARKLPETALAVAADLLPDALTGKKSGTAEAESSDAPARATSRKATTSAPGDQPPTKRTVAKKAPAKKAPTSTAKKATAKTTTAKKTATKKTTAKKASAKKTATTTAPATKATTKKAPAKKVTPNPPAAPEGPPTS